MHALAKDRRSVPCWSVPSWPQIGQSGTPSHFRSRESNDLCFCTCHKGYEIYIPHTLTADIAQARTIFWYTVRLAGFGNATDLHLIAELGEEKVNLYLELFSSHLLVQRRVC